MKRQKLEDTNVEERGREMSHDNNSGWRRARKEPEREVGTKPPFETNPVTLARRQQQIDYGKNTSGYANYLKAIPKEKRSPAHPQTPKKDQYCSRRSFDGQIKVWRLLLHAFDECNNNRTGDDKEARGSEKDEKKSGK